MAQASAPSRLLCFARWQKKSGTAPLHPTFRLESEILHLAGSLYRLKSKVIWIVCSLGITIPLSNSRPKEIQLGS
jgi:hypothetical protein